MNSDALSPSETPEPTIEPSQTRQPRTLSPEGQPDATPINSEPLAESTATPVENATLAHMVTTAQAGRMSPADETQTADLLRQALLGGKPEIGEALDAIAKLPWPVSVNGLNAAWPEMKPYGRRLFVSGMKTTAFDGEIGRRIRLSITRGLVKVDEAQAAKWACAIAAEMLGQDGILTTRDRQSFFNVLVGKGKPWLLRLPIDSLKDDDLAHLLNAAISTIFTGGCPPFTQSAFLLWLIKIGKLEVLSERSQQSIAQSIRRWPGRLMRDFKTLPENLPTILAEAFQEKGAKRADATPGEERDEREEAEDRIESNSTEKTDVDDPSDDEDEDDEEEDDIEEDDEDDEPRGERPKHPPYISPGQPNRPSNQAGRNERGDRNERERGSGNIADPVALLRQLDNFIRQQAQQLTLAKTKLRQLENDQKGGGGGRDKRGRGRGGRYGGGGDNVWPETTQPEDNESLRRYVAQLESINTELRTRLEDLAQDGERRAQSLVSTEGTPLGEREQLVNFLSLKLGKDHADFLKLSSEPEDEVFREHYRIVAQNVFEILAAEGVHPKPPEVPQIDLG